MNLKEKIEKSEVVFKQTAKLYNRKIVYELRKTIDGDLYMNIEYCAVHHMIFLDTKQEEGQASEDVFINAAIEMSKDWHLKKTLQIWADIMTNIGS